LPSFDLRKLARRRALQSNFQPFLNGLISMIVITKQVCFLGEAGYLFM